MLALMDAFYRSAAHSLHCCQECVTFKAQLNRADLPPKGCCCRLGTTEQMCGAARQLCAAIMLPVKEAYTLLPSARPKTAANNLYHTVAARYSLAQFAKIWDLPALVIISMTSPGDDYATALSCLTCHLPPSTSCVAPLTLHLSLQTLLLCL